MKLEDAIKYWVTESGYRQIQTLLSKNIREIQICYDKPT